MLSLFIVEHCSAVQTHATIWKRFVKTVCHPYKKEVSCAQVVQNVGWKEIVGRKVWWSRRIFLRFSSRAVARMSQHGDQKSQGGHIFKYNIGCMQQLPRKKSLAICKLYSHLTRPKKLHRYERRAGWAQSFDVLQLGQGKRQGIAYLANR